MGSLILASFFWKEAFYIAEKGRLTMTLTAPTTYKSLTEEAAIELAKTIQAFDHTAQLTCREIGDGNLNCVFQIEEAATGKRLIIKQALPYARVIGESWPLTLKQIGRASCRE